MNLESVSMRTNGETAMAAKLQAAGVDTAAARLYAEAVAALQRDGKPERAMERFIHDTLSEPALLDALALDYLRRVARDMEGDGMGHRRGARKGYPQRAHPSPADELPVEGHMPCAQEGQQDPALDRQPNGDAAGQTCDAQEGQGRVARPSPASPDRGGTGHRRAAQEGQRDRARPVREPSAADRAASKVVHKAAAATVLDTFGITERQGSRTPVGDIAIASYGRLIATLAKRTWVSSREYNLLCLLDAEAKKQAHIPAGATTRDVFGADAVAALVKTATTLAMPRLPERDMAAVEAGHAA